MSSSKSSSGSVFRIRRPRRRRRRLRKPFPLPISCPKFAQVPSSLPFSSQRAHSNTHLAISLTSSPFRRRSGEVKDSQRSSILSFFAIPSPSKSGGKSPVRISPSVLPSFPAHSSPFFTARLIPVDAGSSLRRPNSDLIINLPHRWPRRATIVALFIPLCFLSAQIPSSSFSPPNPPLTAP